MTLTRRTGALAALALTLILGACSTPADLTAPTLEPQFGTRGYDSVEAVAYGKSGHLYAVGDLGSDAYLRRYDRSGNLVWETYFDGGDPYNTWENQYYGVTDVAVDASGNAFVSWTGSYDEYEGATRVDKRYLSKYDVSGVQKFKVEARSFSELGTDTSGNVYGVAYPGVVTKYTATGARVWEKTLSGAEALAVSSLNSVYVLRGNGFVSKYNIGGTQVWSKKLVPGDADVGTDDPACDYECTLSADYEIAAGISDELHIVGGKHVSDYDGDSCRDETQYLSLYRFDKNGVQGTKVSVPELDYGWCGSYYDPDGPYGTTRFDIGTDNLGNTYLATGRGNDGSVAKFSRTGVQAWSKVFGTSRWDVATSVASYDGSEVFVGGVTNGGLVHRQLGEGDAFLREMDKNGNRVWTR